MTKVAVVTVDYNNHSDTRDLLDSVKLLDLSGLEILWLVVDNGSATSVGGLVGKYPGVQWLQTGRNLGFAGGYNRGMRYAREWGAEYILIINNDTVFGDKNIVKNLLRVLKENPSAGLVSPKIYFAPKYEYYKNKYNTKDNGRVIWYAGGDFDWNNIRSRHRGIDVVDTGEYNLTEKTDFISGCCLMVKREILEKVGYFEEKLFCYYEDSDWVERIKRTGYEQWYSGKSYIYHKVSRTSGIGSSMTDYLITRNRLWFGMKYAGLKTKSALAREALKQLVSGRQAQKDGILDFIKGIWGWKGSSAPDKVDYPLELSIVITNYKTASYLLNLLKSIYRRESGFNDYQGAEVIVLDNSPDEPCREAVLTAYPHIKFIANKTNNGFSAGNNQLISYSQGKFVLLLNSDIEVKSGALINLLHAVNKFGDRAIYGGRLFFPDGVLQDSCYFLPTAWRAFKEYFLHHKGDYFMFSPKTPETVRVEGMVMASFLIPVRVLNELGLLQEATFMYFEDIDYCRRAKNAGIPVYYVPDAEFIHFHGQSSKRAGTDLSNRRLIKASKWYHGWLNYYLIYMVLWWGQKVGRVATPESEWKNDRI